MGSFLIIEGEIAIETPKEQGNGLVLLEINIFILDGSPEALIKNIIKGAPFAVHTDPDLCRFQHRCKSRCCELRTLVGVKNFRMPVSQRLL